MFERQGGAGAFPRLDVKKHLCCVGYLERVASRIKITKKTRKVFFFKKKERCVDMFSLHTECRPFAAFQLRNVWLAIYVLHGVLLGISPNLGLSENIAEAGW